MKKKQAKGITLIALVITIIVLLILAGVAINTLMGDTGIINSATNAAEQSKIASKKTEIELAIIEKMIKEEGNITIEEIIDELEKDGIINEGDGDSNSGQVKTEEDGYIYEIKEDKNGNWEVIYIGKGEIDKTNPTVTATAGTETITEGDSNEISKYFTYTANGTAKIVSVVYTDTSNGNAVVTNTNTLAEGTHIIKCTVTKETGAVASATKTIVVEIDIVGTNPANPNQPDGIPDKYQVRVSYSCVNGSCSFSETYVTLYNEYGEFDEYGGGYLTDEQIPTFTPSPGYQNPTFNVKPTTSYEITKDTVFTATCTAIPIDLVP